MALAKNAEARHSTGTLGRTVATSTSAEVVQFARHMDGGHRKGCYSPQLGVRALDAGHVEIDADGEHEERKEEQEQVEEPELLQLLESQAHDEWIDGWMTPPTGGISLEDVQVLGIAAGGGV